MVKDRYGNTVFSQNAVVVFDVAVGYDSESYDEHAASNLPALDDKRFSSAEEIDLGAGADWPATAYEVLSTLIPFSATVAAFFLGERIERSAHAWKRMVKDLLSCIPIGGFTDANGAALLALSTVFEQTGSKNVSLVAYTWIDEEILFFEEPDKARAAFDLIAKLNEIEPRERQFGVGLHSFPTFLFKFKADEKVVLVSVKKNKVKIAEL